MGIQVSNVSFCCTHMRTYLMLDIGSMNQYLGMWHYFKQLQICVGWSFWLLNVHMVKAAMGS